MLIKELEGVAILLAILGVLFGPIGIGWLVARIFSVTVSGKLAERFEDWPGKSLAMFAFVAVGAIGCVFLFREESLEKLEPALLCFWAVAELFFFAAGFMWGTKKRL